MAFERSFTVELRDWSPSGLAELESLATRYGGHLHGSGPTVTVSASTRQTAETIFHALEADPRVVSNSERAEAATQARLAEHQAAVEEARRADRIVQLEAQVAEQAERIAELERR